MESRAMGIGDGVSGSLILWTVVVASLELGLGVEMKAGYIIVVLSSSFSFSFSSMSKLLLVVRTSPLLWVDSSSTSTSSSCSSNFLLLPSGILFRPRRPGFLPSRLPAPAHFFYQDKFLSLIFQAHCLQIFDQDKFYLLSKHLVC